MSDNNMRTALLIAELIGTQSPAVFAVGGTIYEGRLLRCLADAGDQGAPERWRLVALARAYGTDHPRVEREWRLGELDDLAEAEDSAPADEDEDPLMGHARAQIARAREYGELSLAEQLVVQRIPRGTTHDRSDDRTQTSPEKGGT